MPLGENPNKVDSIDEAISYLTDGTEGTSVFLYFDDPKYANLIRGSIMDSNILGPNLDVEVEWDLNGYNIKIIKQKGPGNRFCF